MHRRSVLDTRPDFTDVASESSQAHGVQWNDPFRVPFGFSDGDEPATEIDPIRLSLDQAHGRQLRCPAAACPPEGHQSQVDLIYEPTTASLESELAKQLSHLPFTEVTICRRHPYLHELAQNTQMAVYRNPPDGIGIEGSSSRTGTLLLNAASSFFRQNPTCHDRYHVLQLWLRSVEFRSHDLLHGLDIELILPNAEFFATLDDLLDE